MTTDVRRDSALTEAQEAFVGLLVQPLVTARTDPRLLRQVLRHRALLSDWAGRLGYRLVVSGGVARLHRDPSGPQRTAAPPAWDTPSRRDLVLLALAVAACEGVGEGATVQELSDEARALSVSPGARVTPYDPDRRAERQAFMRALGRLTEHGVLIRRTTDESLLRQWEEEGTGPGGGYDVDLDALLQFTDPYTVELAFTTDPSDPEDADAIRHATRAQRLLRTLVEDTALLYADLHPQDADYARARRSWLAGQAVELTGGSVELRAEGLLLRLDTDTAAGAAAAPTFPTAFAKPWFALVVLDSAIRSGPAPDGVGRIHLTAPQVDAVFAGVHADKARALTRELAESPGQLRAAVEPTLVGLGLVSRGKEGSWTLQPTAARIRDPVATWEPSLIEAASGDEAHQRATTGPEGQR